MRGCRHSGVRVIVPPRCAPSPTRITCRYVRPQRTPHPPPLMEGEALASRILELGPVGVKFLGPVIIEVPHFAALRGKEREIVILRSDNGETWREHIVDSQEEILSDVLHDSFEADDLSQMEDPASGRITRIVTNDFPQYFAVVSRVKQEVHAIGPEGGMVSSTVVPQVQAVFPQGALTKKIKVGLQAQPIDPELTAKLLGHGVAVSPVVTVEPRRRKFHKAITLSMPAPTAHSQGMINQYTVGSTPTLRLLCSITGGTTRAQWEDVTGSTPLQFVNDCVSFTTTVSARFWLMDCRNVGDATKMATELYKEAIHVPFMAKFVVFAKRVDPLEARLRVFCMTDDKEDKTLEHQEHFTEVAKSRDVEVLEGKPQYVEFAGNLVPITKSGEQLQFSFRAFRENRLPFSVRVKDQHAEAVGRCLFMKEAKVAKGDPPQQPICVLNIVLPDDIISETISLTDSESWKRSGFLKDSYEYYRPDPRLADMSNLLGEDWVPLANQLGLTTSEINVIKSEYPDSVAKQAQSMLRMWIAQSGNRAQGNVLENALTRIGREDIIPQCLNVEPVEHIHRKEEVSRVSKEYYDKERFIEPEEGRGRYEDKYSAEEKIVDTSDEDENFKKTVSERRNIIEKRLSAERTIPASSQRVEIVQEISTIKRQSLVEDKIAEVEKQTLQEPTRTVTTKTTTTPDGKTVTESVEVQSTKPSPLSDAVTTVTTTITQVRTSDHIEPPDKVPTERERKDSAALLEGVTQRLETDKKIVSRITGEDPNSPKLSKTPPPSPADFNIREQAAAIQEWGASEKPTVEVSLPKETPTVDAVQKDSESACGLSYESVLLSGNNRSRPLPPPPLLEYKTTSYTQIDAMLDRMLNEVEKQEQLFALDLDILDNTDRYINTLELVPTSTDALLEVPIKKSIKVHKPKTYETTHEILVGIYPEPTADLITFEDDGHRHETQITDLDEDEPFATKESLSNPVDTESDPTRLDVYEDWPYEMINFQRTANRASSESTSETSDNYPDSWNDPSEDHTYAPIHPLRDGFEHISDVWWEGAYRNLSVVPEEDEENISLLGTHSNRSFPVSKSCEKRESSHSSSVSTDGEEEKQEKAVKAEVKLLVKTTDNGKEEIEIRSVREFLDSNMNNGSAIPDKPKTLPANFSKVDVRNGSKQYRLKESNKNDKPVYTLQRLFIRPYDSDILPIGGSMVNLSPSLTSSRTELLATSPKHYPLQCDSSTVSSYEELLNDSDDEAIPKMIKVGEEKVDLYANPPFYPCYDIPTSPTRPFNPNPFTEFVSNPFRDSSQIPKAYCDWLPQAEDQERGESSGTWQAAPETATPRAPAPLRSEGDDGVEAQASSDQTTSQRTAADQHKLSEEMRQLLKEMEEESKK